MLAVISNRRPVPARAKRHTRGFFSPLTSLSITYLKNSKTRGAKDQIRTDDGTFGSKRFLDCSWRTWLKTMYTHHPGVVCQCTCNNQPLASAQALIKHIERKHYVNKTVVLEDNEITVD